MAPSTKLTIDEVKHVAKLANLDLSSEQIQILQDTLSETIGYVSQIQTLNTTGIHTTHQITNLKNVVREDKIDTTRILSQKEALTNAAHTHQGYFVVPQVLDKE
jgi:aspartyl-tRNA(Asn)/glutamyl-tRNA(Gln) amidotransferase subunit C